jgi:hypothetical protein
MSSGKVVKMTQEEIVQFMLDSFNADNREMAQMAGMSAEQIEESIEKSQMTLQYMLGNLYNKMKEKGLLS